MHRFASGMMMGLAVAAVICAAVPGKILGQTPRKLETDALELSAPESRQEINDNAPRAVHISDWLNAQAPVDEIAAKIRRHQRMGVARGPAAPSVDYTVGDQKQFNVYRPYLFSDQDGQWASDITFQLRGKSSAFYLWVEQAELDNNHVRASDVDSIYSALEERTPAGSYDSENGIIRNNNQIFGDPTDIDNNGRVHILLTDIKDGRTEQEGYIAGFFFSVDLNPDGPGNGGEVIYLDTQPGIYTDDGQHRVATQVEATAAHEYQHLIHFKYDPSERTFVNEGQSEWAEVMNGYRPRCACYLSSPNDSTGYNVWLMLWRRDQPQRTLYDYQRASLLHHYFAEQLGPTAAGAITRESETGVEGYRAILDQSDDPRTFNKFLLDFHTANATNSRQAGNGLGYQSTYRSNLPTQPAFGYDGRTITGSRDTAHVSAGAVQYGTWHHVKDIRIDADAIGPLGSLETQRRYLTMQAAGRRPDGSWVVRRFEPRPESEFFEGEFERFHLAIIQDRVTQENNGDNPPSTVSMNVRASWDPLGQTYRIENIVYDTGQVFTDSENNPVFFTLDPNNTDVMATRFSFPAGENPTLSELSIAPYYHNQFGNTGLPDDAPRDFTLHFYNSSGGSSPVPGPEVFQLSMDDPRSYQPVTSTDYNFLKIDLTDHQDELANLSNTFFVGLSNTGTDDNYLVAGPSRYSGENTSFLHFTQEDAWAELWDLEITMEDGSTLALEETTLPVRATFLVEGEPETFGPGIPASLTLEQNYPNPAAETTTIRYGVPRAGPVQIVVYDALGRRVATLVNRAHEAGSHAVTIDVSGWASGTYHYSVMTDEARVSRSMILIPDQN